jgi:hypothetical protein
MVDESVPAYMYVDSPYAATYAAYQAHIEEMSIRESRSVANDKRTYIDSMTSLSKDVDISRLANPQVEAFERQEETLESYAKSTISGGGQNAVQDQLYASNILSTAGPNQSIDLNTKLGQDLAMFVRNDIANSDGYKQVHRRD